MFFAYNLLKANLTLLCLGFFFAFCEYVDISVKQRMSCKTVNLSLHLVFVVEIKSGLCISVPEIIAALGREPQSASCQTGSQGCTCHHGEVTQEVNKHQIKCPPSFCCSKPNHNTSLILHLNSLEKCKRKEKE